MGYSIKAADSQLSTLTTTTIVEKPLLWSSLETARKYLSEKPTRLLRKAQCLSFFFWPKMPNHDAQMTHIYQEANVVVVTNNNQPFQP